MMIGHNIFRFLMWISSICLSNCLVPRIAICIGGQQSRMQPDLLREGLLAPNQGQFQFDLYYNLQLSTGDKNSIVFNTSPRTTFNASTFGKMNETAVIEGLHRLIHAPPHSNIISVYFYPLIPLEDVEATIGMELKLFEVEAMKSRKVQGTILNMYKHQMRCIEQINVREKQHQFTYDYIISTREDVVFIRPMNLTYVLTLLNGQKIDSKSKKPLGKCNMVMKDCANFRGFNQRMFVYDRHTANVTLSNRWNYFRILLKMNMEVFNTEVFEANMAEHYNFLGCPVFIDHFAVTAVRPVDGDVFCYPYWETFKCLPSNSARNIAKHKCERYARLAKPLEVVATR